MLSCWGFLHITRANFIVIVPGANYVLSPDNVASATARLKGAKVMLVSTYCTAVGRVDTYHSLPAAACSVGRTLARILVVRIYIA